MGAGVRWIVMLWISVASSSSSVSLGATSDKRSTMLGHSQWLQTRSGYSHTRQLVRPLHPNRTPTRPSCAQIYRVWAHR